MAIGRQSLCPVWFSTAAQVLAWQPADANPLTCATVPLAPRLATADGLKMIVGLDNGPWTYWCDFDANPQGGPRGNVYNFPYWQFLDTMYYYVHHLAAIPPAVWTNAAHRNGVKMCVAVTGDCDQCGGEVNKFFADPERAADQLYALASTYGFDGWMIDLEAGADASLNVQQAMKALRAKILPNGQPTEAGYYEAFVYAINDQTYPFFQAGTFYQSDYAPSFPANPDYPLQSYQYLQARGQAAARFNTYWTANVYAFRSSSGKLCNGFDCLDTDGLFATLKRAQATPDLGYYQSLGLYAPDWTIYGGHDSRVDPLPSRDQFSQTNRTFWVGANPQLKSDGTLQTSTPAVSNFIPARSTIVAKPFVTRFNTGEGSFFALAGQKVANAQWNHLSSQDRLPTWIVPVTGSGTLTIADYTYDIAYDGGSALLLQGSLAPQQQVEYELFLTDIRMDQPTLVTFTYLLRNAQSALPYLRLLFSDNTGTRVLSSSQSGWVTATLTLNPLASRLQRIRLGVANTSLAVAPADIVIGEIRVITPTSAQPPAIITPTRDADLLTWTAPQGVDVWYYNVFASGTFVGRTHTTGYDVSATLLPTPGGDYSIQPVNTAGAFTPLRQE